MFHSHMENLLDIKFETLYIEILYFLTRSFIKGINVLTLNCFKSRTCAHHVRNMYLIEEYFELF